MTIENGEDNPYPDGPEEKDLSEDTDTLDGSSGDTMEAWLKDRSYIHDNLISGTYTNESEFPIPPGVLETQGYGTSVEDSEKWFGYSVYGTSSGPDGTPLSGTLSILGDEEVIDADDKEAFISIAAVPTGGVIAGENGDGMYDTYSWEFSPESGVTSSGELIPPGPEQISAIYGKVEGEVVDADGEPVSGHNVSGEGVTVATDSSGKYSMEVPGGVEVELESIFGTVKESILAEERSTVTLNFRFSGLEVTVVSPSDDPIVGVPVSVDAGPIANERTDDSGKVRFLRMPAGNATATISGSIERSEDIGADYTASIVVESLTGVSGRVSVPSSGARPGEVDIKVQFLDGDDIVEEYESISNDDGTFGVGMFETGETIVIISSGDRRYMPSSFEGYLEEGEEMEVIAELEHAENIGTVV